MGNKRTYRTKELKFKVALEAVREQKQVSQIATEYGVLGGKLFYQEDDRKLQNALVSVA